jgi:hypothetical protein
MTKYQIGIFENGARECAETLRSTLEERFDELGVDRGLLAFLDDDTIGSRDRKAPVVGVFLSALEGPRKPGWGDRAPSKRHPGGSCSEQSLAV